jgi:hypothetical protein
MGEYSNLQAVTHDIYILMKGRLVKMIKQLLKHMILPWQNWLKTIKEETGCLCMDEFFFPDERRQDYR